MPNAASSWPVWMTLAGIVFSAYFAYHYIQGSRGISQKKLLEYSIEQHQQTLTSLRAQKTKMEHRAYLLNPSNPDMDMLDEMARRTIGLYETDEQVILLPSAPPDAAAQHANPPN